MWPSLIGGKGMGGDSNQEAMGWLTIFGNENGDLIESFESLGVEIKNGWVSNKLTIAKTM